MGPHIATISLVLLTFSVNSYQSPYSSRSSECPPFYNGSIRGSACNQEYTICVNGIQQAATCSEGYVFYQGGCVRIEESPECASNDESEEEVSYDQFDCSSKADGLYSLGCVNEFMSCAAGVTYQMNCPETLVFNEFTGDCQINCDDSQDYATAPATVYISEEERDSYEEGSGETSEYYDPLQTAEQLEKVDFYCNGLEDGNYANGCSDIFYSCSNNVAFKRYCPPGTMYNPRQQACDYDCTEKVITTTQSFIPVTGFSSPRTTTTVTPEDPRTTQSNTPTYSSIPLDYSSTSTTAWQNTTNFDVPIICKEGHVTTFGICSSRFNRCQNNVVRSKQCPANTLFEPSLLFCVFDLPQCQPTVIPPSTYNSNSPSNSIVSPFDENVYLIPRFGDAQAYNYGPVSRPGFETPLIPNPFYIPSHYAHHYGGYHRGHGRRHHGQTIDSPFSPIFRRRSAIGDQFKDFRRINMGKIKYGNSRRAEGKKRFLIDDEFNGLNARIITSDVQQIFPEHRHSKRYFGPIEDPNSYDDSTTFAPKDFFGATRRKRSAYYGSQQPGYGQHAYQSNARQARVKSDCQQYTTPTFLTFGDCYDQFIYCSGNGLNRMAACPIGETFSKALRACSETCGASNQVVATTTRTLTSDALVTPSVYNENDASHGAVSYTTHYWRDETSTTVSSYDGAFTVSVPSYVETTTTSVPPFDDMTTTSVRSYDQSYPAQTSPNDVSYPTTQTSSNYEPSTPLDPIGDRCSLILSQLFSLGCSHKYIQCSNGAAIVRSCGSSLYFNQDEQSCSFRDQVKECKPQDSTKYYPFVPLPTGSDQSNSYETPPFENPSTTRDSIGDHCTYVSSGIFGIGCSQKYIQCSNGIAVVRSCSASLYFSQSSQTCIPRDLVPECESQNNDVPNYSSTIVPDNDDTSKYLSSSSYDSSEDRISTYAPSVAPYYPLSDEEEIKATTDAGLAKPLPYLTLEDVLSTTQTSTTTTVGSNESAYPDVNISRDDYTTTYSYQDETPTSEAPTEDTTIAEFYGSPVDSEEDVEYDYNQNCTVGSRTSTGFCVKTYLECSAAGFIEKTCRIGKLFDVHANRCVPKTTCGKEAIRDAIKDVIATATVAHTKYEGRCAHVTGEAVFGLGLCSSNYIRCSYGSARLQHCSGGKVFSNSRLECISRESNTECSIAHNPPVKRYYNNNDRSSYCDGKADGLYGNKKDCSAILQCFGGELFEHPSCSSNLAFNELTGKCDYPQKVSGCENHGRTDGACSEHGAFSADIYNCSIFYRCVWGKLIEMRCPSGTVFNPALSVCDWPNAVPSCHGQADTGKPSNGGSSYNDELSLHFASGYVKRNTVMCDYPPKSRGCDNHLPADGSCSEDGAFIADVCNCCIFYRCVYGKMVEKKCPPTTVFNPALSVCDWPSVVPSCRGRVDDGSPNPLTLSSTTSSYGNGNTVMCDYPPKSRGCDNHLPADGSCSEHGAFIADVCNCCIFYRCVWGKMVEKRCPSGTVFNPALSVCDWPSAVPSCRGDGNPNPLTLSSTTSSYGNGNTVMCDYPPKSSGCDNHLPADGSCSEHGAFIADVCNCCIFYRCVYGKMVEKKCPPTTVFNPALSVCDWPSVVPSCRGRVDDGSPNPLTLSSTTPSYVNGNTVMCDYPPQSSGCDNHLRTDGSCSEHGAFIADVCNCCIFYRCVWGKMVEKRCPSGTVFNPALSVCDWPSAVPSCRGDGNPNLLSLHNTTSSVKACVTHATVTLLVVCIFLILNE